MGSQYIQHGDLTVCTNGAQQSLIEVSSQTTVKRSGGQLVATEKDRMASCYVCFKLTMVGSILVAGIGLKMLAFCSVGAAVGSIIGAVKGSIQGYKSGGLLGAIKGAMLGRVKGYVEGGAMGAFYGAYLDAYRNPIGGVIGGILANMAMKVINPCAMMTRLSEWSKLHPKVKISGQRALLESATLDCKLGGVVKIIKPDYAMASDMLCLSFFAYNRTTNPKPPSDYNMEEALDGLSDEQKEKLQSEKLDGYTKLGNKELSTLGITQNDMRQPKIGFKADLYKDRKGNYVLVFRGTYSDPKHPENDMVHDWSKDWVDDNLSQGLGLGSKQYQAAIELSTDIKNRVGKEKLMITGHSLGGGLATAGGAATGCETYAFNPAGVHPSTYEMYDVANPDTSKVHTYYSNQDFLNRGNNNIVMMPNSAGERIRLHTSDEFDFTRGHDLPLLFKAIEAERDKQGNPIIANQL